MAKIIEINESIISIGTDDGGITEVRSCDLNFVQHIGDEVELFVTETKTIVSKKEEKQQAFPAGGININMNQTQGTPVSATSVVYSGKAVSKVVYCLLAFFLGWIGVHKFYAGKIGLGILYIVFCWTYIPGLVAFIEFIVALCKKSDANGKIIV